MILQKVGDCLSYGLTHELLDDNTKGNQDYFKSACLFLYLLNLITATTIKKVKKIFECRRRENISSKLMFDKIFRLIASDIKIVLPVETFEEMVTGLNEFMLPEMIFKKCNMLFAYLPDVFLDGSKVYFIHNNDDEYFFLTFDIDKNYGEEEEECFIELSCSYSKILGHNKEMGILYLRPKDINEMYVEYHINSKQEQFVRGRGIGAIGGMMIIEKDNQLAVKIGDKIKFLKIISPIEMYTIENNDILVTPCFGEPSMFRPYRISLGGDVMNVSYQEAKKYLWNQIENTVSCFADFWRDDFEEESGEDSSEYDSEIFSLRYIDEYFKIHKNLEGDENARVCYLLTKKLEQYLDKDVDVLDYFYVLLDVSRRYEEFTWNTYLSEKVYWRIIEMEVSGELEECIFDANEFREKLLEDAFWSDERIQMKERINIPDGQVGYFEFIRNKLDALTVSKDEGICKGGIIMMAGVMKKGVVAYNFQSGKYEIQYSRLLSDTEISKVIKRYDLKDKPYRITIEDKD